MSENNPDLLFLLHLLFLPFLLFDEVSETVIGNYFKFCGKITYFAHERYPILSSIYYLLSTFYCLLAITITTLSNTPIPM